MILHIESINTYIEVNRRKLRYLSMDIYIYIYACLSVLFYKLTDVYVDA